MSADILEVIMAKRYQANEKDLDKVFNYLRTNHPEIATPENAVSVNEVIYVIVHEAVAHGKTLDIDEAIELAIKRVFDSKD